MKRFLAFVLIVSMILGLTFSPAFGSQTSILSKEQRNAIAMLNYITVLTKEINDSKNSRMYLEQAYSSLINNTYPNSIDNRTLSQLTGLLDIMEDYRMIDVKRDRLRFIYEQNQAQSIRAAIPNPIGLLAAVKSFDPSADPKQNIIKVASAIVYMAVDSYTSYTAHTSETELQYLKDGWALDDEAAQALHISRKSAFNYMVKMVGDYNLPGDLTLTENAVDEFVKWKNNENVVSRIQFLESNKKTYESFGGYWLLLSESYYNNGEYMKALEALDTYEGMDYRIFRKDYELARVLPLAISAVEEALSGDEMLERLLHYVQLILDNSGHDDWALRYFAAQTYLDLSAKSQNDEYLKKAYNVILDNVNYLIGEQQTMNETYLSAVSEKTAPKDATKDEKKQIKDYNTSIKENRKVELPPISEALLLNCDLLFALVAELNLADSEKSKIDNILHHNGEPAFLVQELDNKYRYFENPQEDDSEINIEYGGTAIILPVTCVTDKANIVVSIKEKDSDDVSTITDWSVDEVERSTEGDISSFRVAYNSEEARKYSWKPDAEITIDILPREGSELKPYHFEYTTHGTKNAWYDYLKVWEGHKNNWYDYGKVWENSVRFERTL